MSKVLVVRLSEEEKQTLRELAVLDSRRDGKRVSMAEVVRRLLHQKVFSDEQCTCEGADLSRE